MPDRPRAEDFPRPLRAALPALPALPGRLEDQIGALGLVLNALVLFNTRNVDAAVTQLRNDGFEVRDDDVARLSPFVRHHINVLGRYSFQLPDLPGGLRPLSDMNAADDE